MTILAQLNDCHSCNDARSIVQKKVDFWVLTPEPPRLLSSLLSLEVKRFSVLAFSEIIKFKIFAYFGECFLT